MTFKTADFGNLTVAVMNNAGDIASFISDKNIDIADASIAMMILVIANYKRAEMSKQDCLEAVDVLWDSISEDQSRGEAYNAIQQAAR